MNKPTAPFTQQPLRYQRVPRQGVAVDTFGEALHIVSTARAVMEKSLHMKRRGYVFRCQCSSN